MKITDIKIGLVAGSVVAFSSLFSQAVQQPACKPQVCCVSQEPCPPADAAYVAPARIDVKCPWDFFAFGSFTYTQPMQDNMEYAVISNTTSTILGLDWEYQKTDMGFKPGFKVGLGMNFDRDDWDSLIQYTWFRGSQTTSSSVDPAGSEGLVPLWSTPSAVDFFTSGSIKWRLNMDLLDYELGRWGYYGRQAIIRPFVGARAAWIRQKADTSYADSVNSDSLIQNESTNSWAIGPRAGFQTNWMIGEGFRFYGNGAGDILFTRYTKLKSSIETIVAGVLTSFGSTVEKNLNTLRAHLECELGFGWGTYLDCNKWHIDLALGYGFQVFFDQNMFRHFEEAGAIHSTVDNGNLYMQGLNASIRLDF